MGSEAPATDHQRVLIYDGQCRLCVTAKEGLERIFDTPGVRFVPYRSEEAVRRLGGLYKPGRPDAAFLVESDGTISHGLDAFVPLLPGLPGGRVMLLFLRIPFLRPLTHLAYRIIARNRYRWFGEIKTPAR